MLNQVPKENRGTTKSKILNRFSPRKRTVVFEVLDEANEATLRQTGCRNPEKTSFKLRREKSLVNETIDKKIIEGRLLRLEALVA
jgi:hypothetical protein